MKIVTPCGTGATCIEIEDIGADWFRIRSTVNRHAAVAVTGEELRAFVTAVKGGVFDVLFPERIP
jgi:hypothetical protein